MHRVEIIYTLHLVAGFVKSNIFRARTACTSVGQVPTMTAGYSDICQVDSRVVHL